MERQQTAVGAILPNGFRILANYMDQLIIAQNQHSEAPEPFVVWHLNRDGDTWCGSYFRARASAERYFCKEISVKQELHRVLIVGVSSDKQCKPL